MAVVIKTKNLKYLLDQGCDSSTVGKMSAMGVALEKRLAFGGIRLHYSGQHWSWNKLDTSPLPEWLDAVVLGMEVWPHNKAPESSMKVEAANLNAVVPLRDAKVMYQRVTGTSEGSVYVLVAVSTDGRVKVAAKVDPLEVSLSVRAEGEGLVGGVVQALTSQGLSLKAKKDFKYMSGHFMCDGNAPPAKVLGAILLGSGLEFNTSLPVMAKVKDGSK